jgi:hypothetical protein
LGDPCPEATGGFTRGLFFKLPFTLKGEPNTNAFRVVFAPA